MEEPTSHASLPALQNLQHSFLSNVNVNVSGVSANNAFQLLAATLDQIQGATNLSPHGRGLSLSAILSQMSEILNQLSRMPATQQLFVVHNSSTSASTSTSTLPLSHSTSNTSTTSTSPSPLSTSTSTTSPSPLSTSTSSTSLSASSPLSGNNDSMDETSTTIVELPPANLPLLGAPLTVNAEPHEAGSDYLGYHWRSTRGGWRQLKQTSARRAYYVCSEHEKKGCTARFYKTVFDDGRRTFTTKGDHNHMAPPKSLSAEAHASARQIASMLPPAQAQEHIIRELNSRGEASTPENTPTRTQLRNKRTYQARSAAQHAAATVLAAASSPRSSLSLSAPSILSDTAGQHAAVAAVAEQQQHHSALPPIILPTDNTQQQQDQAQQQDDVIDQQSSSPSSADGMPLLPSSVDALEASLSNSGNGNPMSQLCRLCKHGRFNQGCVNKLCKNCCGANVGQACSIAGHRSAKRQRAQLPWTDIVDAAIKLKRPLHMMTDDGNEHVLQPTGWGREGYSFSATEIDGLEGDATHILNTSNNLQMVGSEEDEEEEESGEVPVGMDGLRDSAANSTTTTTTTTPATSSSTSTTSPSIPTSSTTTSRGGLSLSSSGEGKGATYRLDQMRSCSLLPPPPGSAAI